MSSTGPNDQLAQISKKLDVLIRLGAINAVKGLKEKRQVEILSDAGFAPRDIAGIVGTTPNAVRIRLHRMRKEKAAEADNEGEQEYPAASSESGKDPETKE